MKSSSKPSSYRVIVKPPDPSISLPTSRDSDLTPKETPIASSKREPRRSFSNPFIQRKNFGNPLKNLIESARVSPRHSEKTRIAGLKPRFSPTPRTFLTTTSEIKSHKAVLLTEKKDTEEGSTIDFIMKTVAEKYDINMDLKLDLFSRENQEGSKSLQKKKLLSLKHTVSQNLSQKSMEKSTVNFSKFGLKKLPLPLSSVASLEKIPYSMSRPTYKKGGSTISPSRLMSGENTPCSIDRFIIKQYPNPRISDETLSAWELAEEICKTYKTIQETASHTKEARKKLVEILERENVIKIFFSKIRRQPPLQMRIYHEMVEFVETTSSMSNVDTRNNLLFGRKIQGIKRGQMKAKLIKEKYHIFKRISVDFEELVLQYKLQNIKRIENNIVQAFDDFGNRKQAMLRSLWVKNKNKYNEMNKQCERLEASRPGYDYEDLGEKLDRLEENYGDGLKLDRSRKIVNNELNNLMRRWTNKVLGVA